MDVPSDQCRSKAECSGELCKYQLSLCDPLSQSVLWFHLFANSTAFLRFLHCSHPDFVWCSPLFSFIFVFTFEFYFPDPLLLACPLPSSSPAVLLPVFLFVLCGLRFHLLIRCNSNSAASHPGLLHPSPCEPPHTLTHTHTPLCPWPDQSQTAPLSICQLAFSLWLSATFSHTPICTFTPSTTTFPFGFHLFFFFDSARLNRVLFFYLSNLRMNRPLI